LPSIAASVSTFVVSWKEAAERNDSVAREAADLLHHLPDDQLDVLVVDVDALRLVDLLDLVDEVELRRRGVLEPQQVGRVQRALMQGVAGLDRMPVADEQPRPPRELVGLLGRLAALAGRHDRDLRAPLGVLDEDLASGLRQRRSALRIPSLEDLDDTGEAVRDVGAGHAARVERAHGQLGSRLADRLGSDDPDCIADLGERVGREENAVTEAADAELAPALQHRADRDGERLGKLPELVGHVAKKLHRRHLALLR
jgi:hypothetical protein